MVGAVLPGSGERERELAADKCVYDLSWWWCTVLSLRAARVCLIITCVGEEEESNHNNNPNVKRSKRIISKLK